MITGELLWAIPFVLLLGAIATGPLFCKHWWERNYTFVSIGLGLLVVGYYILGLKEYEVLLHTGHEYISFICLIGSLFIVSGGIHIGVKGESTPAINCVFLLLGAFLANFLGTTGASMILIRPWIRMNKYRITAYHIIFFIFIVSNVGGCLTPIGDPPLFLGYLKGIPFFWTLEHLWTKWLTAVVALLAIFFMIDSQNFKKAPLAVRIKETANETWKFDGLHNIFFLLVILGSVFIQNPPFVREGVMVICSVLSYRTTARSVHDMNAFSFGPIQEVAILFLGIFATMIPALGWLEHNAAQLGIHHPLHFYWGSGILSSVLDNAPTYLNFLSAAQGLFASGEPTHEAQLAKLLADYPLHIQAISCGSVFFGAMTYIGNGPNFLVKAIADRSKIKTPTFFGYIFRYSLPILLPVLALLGWFYFAGVVTTTP